MSKAGKGAAAKDDAATEGASESSGQGRAVLLPDGTRRIDYIHKRYYDDGAKRGDIMREINKMLEDAGRGDEKIAYQIVYAGTKKGQADPRKKAAAAASE